MKNHSMSGRRRGVRSPSVTSPPVQRRRDVTVELNSQVPLPCFWEQCLDIRTGQVLYRNQITGETTSMDPRLPNFNSDSSDIDTSSNNGSNNSSSEDNVDLYFSSSTDMSGSSSDDSSSSSSSGYCSSEVVLPEAHQRVLILAGCRRCYVYLMVPKHEVFCPQCNQPLFDFTAPNY